MICFIRHSERLDSVDMQKWKKHERYNENEYDQDEIIEMDKS